MIIDTEKNNKNEIKKQKLIEQADGHIIGAVLNKTANDKSSNYYNYYGDED